MMKRAGISEHGVMLIIFSIIVVLGIFVILPILGRFLGSGGVERTATVQLETLSQRVLEMYIDKNPSVSINHPLFIQENAYIIVAFNEKDDKIESGCYEETATRPFACVPDKSCLCLYEDTAIQDFDDDLGENHPIQCEILPPDIVFVAPIIESGGDPIKGWNMGIKESVPSIKQGQENLLLYGQCDNMIWNDQLVTIQKLKLSDGKSQIFIARKAK